MTTNKSRPFGWQDKLGYAMGDMGCGFSFQLVSTFMILFYQQYIGVDPAHYAVIIVLAKLFDAVNDVVIGNLVDTKRIGKKSKYTPWIILGGLTLVIFNVMIFTPVTGFSPLAKDAWCLVAYCLWSVSYTMVNVPYGSLHSVITDKPQERVALSTFRSIGAALPAVVIMIILPGIVYDENDQIIGEKLLPVAIIMSIFSFLALWGTTKLVKERVHRETEVNEVTGFGAMMSSVKSFFTNRAMVGATIATVASVALFNSTMSLNNMVFQYFFKDTGKIGLAMVGSYAPMIVVMAFIGKLTKKLGKKKLLVITMLTGAVSGVLSIFAPITPDKSGMILYIVCLMGLNLGNTVFQVSVWAIIADCIEVSYRKTGKSEEGSLYALYSFFRKLSQGIGQAVAALGLKAIGFKEGADFIPEPDFGDKVKSLYFVVLAVGSLIAYLAMQFIYNIGKKEEEEFAMAQVSEAVDG